MTGSTIERHQATTLADDRDYMNRALPEEARRFAASMLCPAPWRIERGDKPEVIEQKVADLTIVGRALARLDLPLDVNVVPQVYVVHGRPGYMAQLQIMLAGRWGCLIVPLDDESDAAVGVVKVLGKDREWHRVTVTIEEARTAGWVAKNPNYKSMPDRMLMARAVTKAIGMHCPEAKLMLPPADLAELDDMGLPDADPVTGAISPPPSAPAVDRQVPPGSVAPDGHTIPEHLREPAIDDEQRAELIATLAALPDDIADRVRTRAQEAAIPNLKSARVTRAHGVLVAMLIEHAKSTAAQDGARFDDDRPLTASVPDQAPDGDESVGAPSITSQGPERVTPEVVAPDTQLDLEDDGRPFE